MLFPKLDYKFISSRAGALAENIIKIAREAKGNEAQLVAGCDHLFAGMVEQAGLKWDPVASAAERRVAWLGEEGEKTGRIDRFLFNKLVIEFEPPGSLQSHNSATTNKHAIKQVRQYIDGLKKEGHKEISTAGLAMDGFRMIYCRYSSGQWIQEAPLETNAASVARLLRLILTFQRPPLLPDAVMEKFGEQNDHTAQLVNALYMAIKQPKHAITSALFAQWQDFFADVAGLTPEALAGKEDLIAFARRVSGQQDVDPARLLFALYTYSAILIKLLVVVAVLPFLNPEDADRIVQWNDNDDDWIKDKLKEIESGELFGKFVTNFTEGDFFGWYVEEWTPEIAHCVRRLLSLLAEFDPDAVEQAPERVRDLLKRLYHGLFPREVRHDLGEYYTPDWLAERLLSQLDSDLFSQKPSSGPAIVARVKPRLTKTSFTDPACGSGTFLILIIRRLRQWARECGVNEHDVLLPALLRNVVGFDLNPLAVISSRANFLLSIADLLRPGDEPAELPVYLADSIVMPSNGKGLLDRGIYRLPLRGINEELHIPAQLAERERLKILAHLLSRDVKSGEDVAVFIRACEGELGLSRASMIECKTALTDLYETLCNLHKDGRNGIWANIAKNMFMPLFVQRADFVIGNPPWVNWDSLPQVYRERSKPHWIRYGLFVHSGMEAILGKGNKDISTLLTYVAADQYLKDGGKLGFVITQSVFKTGAGQGFRRFQIGNDEYLKVEMVDDFSSMQPFEEATNRTAVFVLRKGAKTTYPVTYNRWKQKGRKRIPFSANLEAAAPLITYKAHIAEPISQADITSSWINASRSALGALRKVQGQSDYKAYVGAYSGGANAIYWLRHVATNPDGTWSVRNITENARRIVKEEEHRIEPGLLYPLLRGRDVKRWSAMVEDGAFFLIVQDPETRIGIAESQLKDSHPRTYSYLSKYKELLLKRQSQTIKRLAQKVFYSMFAIGHQTFSRFKVVWPEMGQFGCAVSEDIAGKPVVPDHKVMLIPTETAREAHYICAVANSSPFVHSVMSYSITLQQNPHILENLHIPKFDLKNSVHKELSKLSLEAHSLVSEGVDGVANIKRAEQLAELELRINELSAKIWGLDDAELSAIDVSLTELRS